MPFIFTTKRRSVLVTRSAAEPNDVIDVTVSRVAVATMEEARVAVIAALSEAKAPPTAFSIESGGTVGPLPDGTTIEVEDLSLVEMYRRAGFEWDAHGPDAMVPLSEVLAVFNEANR